MQMPEPLPPPTAPGLRRRAVTRLLATAPLALRLPAADAAPAAKPILIQFSHVVAPQTAKGQAALRFKELAETRTAGQVRVEVYPNSTLYKDGEEVEALRLGAVQMLATSLSKLAKWGGGDFELFDLPFLFKDQAAFHAAVDGPAGAALLRQLDAASAALPAWQIRVQRGERSLWLLCLGSFVDPASARAATPAAAKGAFSKSIGELQSQLARQ